MAENTIRGEIIARDLNRMIEELAAIDATIEFRDVIIGVAERIVNRAGKLTDAAALAKIRKSQGFKEYTTFSGKTYRMTNRFPDALWNSLTGQAYRNLQTKLNARGLAKQSWDHVGASFGASSDAPAYVKTANFSGRQYPTDGASKELKNAGAFALEIINSSPIVQAAGGKYALLKAMAGETMYFEKNLENRAFATVASRAKKYPQIFARRGV